jgi:inhibitor of cysteine peptidase
MKIYLILYIVLSVILTACGRGIETGVPANEVQISDPAKNLEAVAGNEFKIMINSNPTTGYHWELAGKFDSKVVEFISNDYKGDEPVMPGSGGVEIWTFKALSAGETEITLGYYPPSKEPTNPQQTVTFTVKVK